MDDLISRQEALDAIIELCKQYTPTKSVDHPHIDFVLEAIKGLPSAEHEECEYIITKGKAGYHEEYKCSACGDSFYWTQDRNIPSRFNYCRNCGRKIIRFIEKEIRNGKI